MGPSLARISISLALLLSVIWLAGCAATTPQATATPEPVPTDTPTPKPTATPWPTPTPSPTPDAARALLQEISSKQAVAKSYRGQMELAFDVKQAGVPQSIKMIFDLEAADPDMHMKVSAEGLPLLFDMEIITKGDVTYMKSREGWTAMPSAGNRQQNSAMSMAGIGNLESFLDDAADVRLAGQRKVKGVDCDVISFALSDEKMRELMESSGSAAPNAFSRGDMQFDNFEGEVAIGAADKLLRQMSVKMDGYANGQLAEGFSMRLTMTVWDVNAKDIVIKAPAGVKPPAASSTPTTKPGTTVSPTALRARTATSTR